MARALERDAVDVVLVQHEYGVFGGPDGEHVLLLADALRVPLAVTLHTVLSQPSTSEGWVLRGLCAQRR